jgi:hypothetical protein
METQKTLKSQRNLEQKRSGSITILHFNTYCRTIVAKAACYWERKKTDKDQWNRIENLEIKHSYSQLAQRRQKHTLEKGQPFQNGT